MYELQYTQQIVDAIIHELPEHAGRKVKAVKILVGEKLQLDLKMVLSHYQDIVSGTALEAVELQMTEELTEVQCNACGFRGPLRERDVMMCSSCHSKNVKPVAGFVVSIQNVELHPLT